LQIIEHDVGRLLLFSDLEFSARFFEVGQEFQAFMDGTFKTSHSNFYQLYIIYAKMHNQCFPLFNAFL
jgi:hypothetical protein